MPVRFTCPFNLDQFLLREFDFGEVIANEIQVLGFLGVGGFGVLGLSDQDLTIQTHTWVDANDAPDTFPTLATAEKSVKISGGLAELTTPVYREIV